LYWQIRRIVLDHDETDDVLQETFIKVFRNLDGFKQESSLFSWMYRIATNEALSHLRSRSRKGHVTDSQYVQTRLEKLESDPYFEGDEAQIRLQEALATLPNKQKMVFNMKYFDDMKYEEISEILGTSVGALKASYHLAVKKIHRFITH
jgi:RNA polymerase sigma-70 factor (ECF subfamily)